MATPEARATLETGLDEADRGEFADLTAVETEHYLQTGELPRFPSAPLCAGPNGLRLVPVICLAWTAQGLRPGESDSRQLHSGHTLRRHPVHPA